MILVPSKALPADLEKQWIVWVEESHLVNRIELDGAGLGIEILRTQSAEAIRVVE